MSSTKLWKNSRYGIAGSDDLVDVQPARNELFAAVLDKTALEGRFGADEEGVALRGEGVAALLVFRQELEADQRVHDRGQTAGRGARHFLDFRDGFRSAVENVEDMVADGRLQHEGWNIAPGHLHNAFGGHLHRGRGCHSLSSFPGIPGNLVADNLGSLGIRRV